MESRWLPLVFDFFFSSLVILTTWGTKKRSRPRVQLRNKMDYITYIKLRDQTKSLKQLHTEWQLEKLSMIKRIIIGLGKSIS